MKEDRIAPTRADTSYISLQLLYITENIYGRLVANVIDFTVLGLDLIKSQMFLLMASAKC